MKLHVWHGPPRDSIHKKTTTGLCFNASVLSLPRLQGIGIVIYQEVARDENHYTSVNRSVPVNPVPESSVRVFWKLRKKVKGCFSHGSVIWKSQRLRGMGGWGFYMGVSLNGGTPKWMVYNGKPYENGWFGGTIILGNPHIHPLESKMTIQHLKIGCTRKGNVIFQVLNFLGGWEFLGLGPGRVLRKPLKEFNWATKNKKTLTFHWILVVS